MTIYTGGGRSAVVQRLKENQAQSLEDEKKKEKLNQMIKYGFLGFGIWYLYKNYGKKL